MERGAGVHQLGMRVAGARLAAGDWVHVFPEGTRSRGTRMGPCRRGVGALVAACEQPPLVVPFVHSGDSLLQYGWAVPVCKLTTRGLTADVVVICPGC